MFDINHSDSVRKYHKVKVFATYGHSISQPNTGHFTDLLFFMWNKKVASKSESITWPSESAIWLYNWHKHTTSIHQNQINHLADTVHTDTQKGCIRIKNQSPVKEEEPAQLSNGHIQNLESACRWWGRFLILLIDGHRQHGDSFATFLGGPESKQANK